MCDFSMGDGMSYPIHITDEDSTTLLGNNYIDCEVNENSEENIEF